MKSFVPFQSFCVLLTIAGAALTAGNSEAVAISLSPSSPNFATGNESSQSEINAILEGIIPGELLVYKQNVGEKNDTGLFASSYQTTFSNTPLDPEDALIQYVGGSSITSNAYLLIKDGNQEPAWYLYDLTALGWTGTEDITMQDYWPRQGAISHVAIYDTPPSDVPEGGAGIALLGLGLTAIGLFRRKFHKA